MAVPGAEMPAELSMQIELDLQTSQGNLGRRVTGLHVERPLETAMEVACKILVKLVEVSDRFDILSNSGKRPAVAKPRGFGPREMQVAHLGASH